MDNLFDKFDKLLKDDNSPPETEYKCINCGDVKQGNKKCFCSYCGYPMYKAPFDRREKIISEIYNYVDDLKSNKIDNYAVQFVRRETIEGKEVIVKKYEDDDRFPSFTEIQKYACSSNKTEQFISRMKKTISEVGLYLHTDYSREYFADFSEAFVQVSSEDRFLEKVLEIFDIKVEIAKPVFPKLILKYSELPDTNLIDKADCLLELLNKITDKLFNFIKLNNVYGVTYKEPIKITLEADSDNPQTKPDYIDYLESVMKELTEINNKKYTLDIFSDGTKEIKEILYVIWLGIYTLLNIPFLKKSEHYIFEDNIDFYNRKYLKYLSEKLSKRYTDINIPDISDKSDDELFALYTQLLKADNTGYFNANSHEIIPIGSGEKKLDKLIGLNAVKSSVKKIKSYVLANKNSEIPNLHMCFYGNPGTGKTEVARIIAEILFENKILPSNEVVEVDRSSLIGQYVGETAIKTITQIKKAMGGVLFIDEAYSLIPKHGKDYGEEAVATLIKAMEDYRGQFCVIMAGYRKEMEYLLDTNPGFKSRIQFTLDFPNYSREELKQITNLMLSSRKYTITDSAMEKILDITDIKRKEQDFANARELRNILDQTIMCQNIRMGNSNDYEIGLIDVNQYIADNKINLPILCDKNNKTAKILTGNEELEQLVGLSQIKRTVKKIRAYAKRNAQTGDFNIHMCFYGNPGTGKTEVARIISRILFDAGVLSESKLVETDSTGLIGQVVGETGAKTHDKIMASIGGVLFIDEAYALMNNQSYGDEAIAVLLKDMEDYRGQFWVIMAGYRKEMENLLDTNPGFKSRIQFTLDFPDYTRDELSEIVIRFLQSKNYKITDDALSKILDLTDYFRQQPDFANARTVRNIAEQVIMNQNLRTEDIDDDFTVILSDVQDYILDENIDLTKLIEKKIGFV
jgi:AAA+ superfamily predicted ATPase